MDRRRFLWLAPAVLAMPAIVRAQPAPGVQAELLEAAKKAGRLSIYATTDVAEASALLEAFRAAHPGLEVEYADQNSTELYSRFTGEAAAGGGTADLLWSSAMDLQIKLVNDGHAQEYRSPEAGALPDWAVFRNMAYGTTAEPVGFTYNTRLVPEGDIPRTHAALTKLISEKPAYQGKITSYDPERSGVGYLFITQAVQVDQKGTWELVRAVGKSGAKLYTSSGAMFERIASGEHLIGFNMLSSYGWERAKKDPSIGVVLPTDHTLVMSRIAFVARQARNPAGAKLFLDFMLSKPGQAALSTRSLPPVRTDMKDVTAKLLGGAPEGALRPIKVGPELLETLNATKRLRFLKEWQTALKG